MVTMKRRHIRRLMASSFRLFTHFYLKLRPGIRILMYHRVTNLSLDDQLTVPLEAFEKHVAYLSEHHNVISLARAIEILDTKGPPTPAVCITFDDGYLDNLTNALPVLHKHGLPVTIFVTTDFGSQVRRHPRYHDEPGRVHLDWDEMKEMSRASNVTFGSHTLSHPFLTRLSEPEARKEIVESREQIQQKLGQPVEFFCYPSGDFGTRDAVLVEQAGYKAAVSVAPGTNRATTPRYAFRRTEINYKDSVADVDAKIDGAFDPVHSFLHIKRRIEWARAGFY